MKPDHVDIVMAVAAILMLLMRFGWVSEVKSLCDVVPKYTAQYERSCKK